MTAPEPWQDRLRRPERFSLVHPDGAVSGIIRHVIGEADDDRHIRLALDHPGDAILNERNRDGQDGCLVVEIEPWQHGQPSQALGAERVSHRHAEVWADLVAHLKAHLRLHVAGPIVVDDSPGHGWIEIHSPTSITILPSRPDDPRPDHLSRPDSPTGQDRP